MHKFSVKGPVKLMQQVKIAHSFLQSVSHFSFLTNLENQQQYTAEFVLKALKHLFFALLVFITPEICPLFILSRKR